MTDQVVIHDAARGQWLHFTKPKQVFELYCIDEVVPKLLQIESTVQEHGLYAAGFISYEAAPAFDSALQVRDSDAFPLMWFGIYQPPEVIQLKPCPEKSSLRQPLWSPSVSRVEYDCAIARIKEYIAHGETYQVNYTFRLNAPYSCDSWTFFLELIQSQQPDYGAYIKTNRFTVCSASPELFFLLQDNILTSMPMKGTAPRGLTFSEDNARARWLKNSGKNRAENVMIVDMIRNDMGKVAHHGTVCVPGLFNIERYPNVWQMTSTVTSQTDAEVCEIIAALFPCASITGAPKPRTMHIISNLETTPRRVYTGCIGFITPDREAQFNVAIRTVLFDREKEQAEFGVGGGIVWDSVSWDEYEECTIKAKILHEKQTEFSLLETILWSPGEGYFLFEYHLNRLHNSAVYFGFEPDMDSIRKYLEILAESFTENLYKVRLLVSRDGTFSCEQTLLSLDKESKPVHLALALTPIDPSNRFLYHKTTNRQVYENARKGSPGCDDVLLWNERNEITESSIANVVVKLDGELVTPPVSCGLLPGTFRAWLLEHEKVKESVITIESLKLCENIYLVNSVRKWRTAVLVKKEN